MFCCVVYLDHFDADPDPAFLNDAAPDPALKCQIFLAFIKMCHEITYRNSKEKISMSKDKTCKLQRIQILSVRDYFFPVGFEPDPAVATLKVETNGQ